MSRVVVMQTSMAGETINVSFGDPVRMTGRRADLFVERGLARELNPGETFDDDDVVNYSDVSAAPQPSPATTPVVTTTTPVVTPATPVVSDDDDAAELVEPLIVDLNLNKSDLDRLIEALATLAEDIRPTTVAELIEYAATNDPTKLRGLGRATWARVEEQLELYTSNGGTGDPDADAGDGD